MSHLGCTGVDPCGEFVMPNGTKLTGPRPPAFARKKTRTRGSGWTRG